MTITVEELQRAVTHRQAAGIGSLEWMRAQTLLLQMISGPMSESPGEGALRIIREAQVQAQAQKQTRGMVG